MLVFALISCGPKEAEVEAAPEPAIRVLRGPWSEDAEMLALSATGRHGGPAIVVAIWVDEGVLSTATSLDAGRGWTSSREVDTGVRLDSTGQLWPRLGLALGRPVVAYAVEGEVRLAQGGAEGWEHKTLAETDATGLGMAMVWDEPVVVWSETDGTVRQSDGETVTDVGEGVCTCCRPAIHVRDGDVRVDVSDDEACDGPVVDGEEVLRASGGVVTRDGVVRPPILEGWSQEQARGAAGIDAWLEVRDGQVRPVLGGVGLITTDEAILGDPIVVSGEIWLPFWAGRTVLAAWRRPDTT